MSTSIYPTLPGSLIEVGRSVTYDTVVQREASGRELRISRQTQPVYRYRISYDFLRQDATTDEAATLYGFLMAHRGAGDSFLFLDPYDSTVTAQEFGVGDTTTTQFQLQRHPGGTVADLLGTWPVYTASRTNLLTRSEEFTHSNWTKYDVAAADTTAVVNPGSAGKTVDYFSEVTSGGGLHYMSSSPTLTATAHTFSIYAKADTRSKIRLSIGSDKGTFDLAAGTATNDSGTSASITSVGNGWYRCVFCTTAGVGEPVIVYMLDGTGADAYTGTTGYGVFIWGAQVESGTTATRYIATTSAAVTERPSFWPGGVYEPIYAPAWASVAITNAGAATTAWTPGTTGIATFTSAPASGNALAWSGTFYRRVRFDGDSLEMDRRHSRIWKGSVNLVSVIG